MKWILTAKAVNKISFPSIPTMPAKKKKAAKKSKKKASKKKRQ